jgi:hypothetical protein
MRLQRLVIAAVCAGMAFGPQLAWAGGSVGHLMQQVRDPGTGLEVRVFQGPAPGDVVVEVGNQMVGVQQKYVAGRSVTVVTTPTEQIALTVGLEGFEVAGGADRVVASPHDTQQLARLSRIVRQSDAVQRAIGLLGRIRLGARSPIGHVLVLTRAVLQSASGDGSAGLALARWAQQASAGSQVRPAAFEGGPGDCWDEYAREAIEAWSEYEDCVTSRVLSLDECAVIYDLRAIGAFSWWVTCVGIRG